MVDTPQVSDDMTVDAMQLGDTEIFSSIYKRYWYKLYIIAYRKLEDKELAEEVVQDVFTRLWKERLTVRISNLERYLYTAVRYEVIDIIRLRGSEKAV